MATNGASPNHSPKPGVSSPWSQIVAAAAPPSSPPPPVDSAFINSAPTDDVDNAGGNNVNSGKRPAWNKPSNGASSSVMGADSWPALSESARSSAKSPSPSESAKGSMDAMSTPSLQGSGSVVPSPHRQDRDNVSANNTVQTHQKSFNKRGNFNPSSNGGHIPPQTLGPQGLMAPAGSHNYNSSLKEHQPRAGFVPNDHPPQRNSFRHRNGGGPHQRGDGHHHNYGGRRDHDRGNQDWSNHRNFNGRDNYMSPRFVPRFIRPPPPPNLAQIYPPPPAMRPPYGSIGYPELPPQMLYVPPPPMESMRGVPFVSPIPPNAMFFQPTDNHLHSKIVNQIDYYFSNDNLVKDIYLRRNMDDQGWVPISLISNFKKVKYLTENIQTVIDAVRASSVVEIQGDKVRKRNDWRRWIMPPAQLPNSRGSQTVGQLAEQVQNITLETTMNDDTGVLDVSQDSPFGELNGQYLLSTSESTGQVGIQVSDHSISARN
ncbi:la-related protein 1C [Vigna radiata var. radiata]|uniref:La-related protein 1C n=1 Tax=Vigna radiata var. radiata TaxID=3916 RepID=A0A1S3UVW6_VIGRR|nr:la-related protein 1C [Vigna radiata var. radiata]